jgi:hypothetical protein
MTHLIPLFHEHFAYAFPSITLLLSITGDNYAKRPAHLINAICAVVARYSPRYAPQTRAQTTSPAVATSKIPGSRHVEGEGEGESASAAHTWATCAKQQVSLQLAVPSLEMVETLLLLSWYEFGQDRDSVSAANARGD